VVDIHANIATAVIAAAAIGEFRLESDGLTLSVEITVS
jgi:hypothetical protein